MERLTVSDKLCYAMGGGFASNLSFYAMLVFFITYASDVYGVNPATVGAITLAARGIDAFIDPVMGAMGDRTRTRLGKYRFWIITSAPVLGFTTWMVFASPDFSTTGRIVYIACVYMLYSLVSTVSNIPYHSLTAYITDKVNERSNIVLFKQFTGIIAQFIVSAGGIYILSAFSQTRDATGNVVVDFHSYHYLGILFGVVTTLGFWICAYGARRQDNWQRIVHDEKGLQTDPAGEQQNIVVAVFKQLSLAFRSRSLGCLALASSANTLSLAITAGVTVQFYTWVLHNTKLVATGALLNMLFGASIYLLVKWLVSRYGNKTAFVIICFIAMVPSLILWLTFSPENVTFTLILLACVMAFCHGGSLITWMMVTDCADELRWKTKKNAAGIASSTLTFSNKFGSALGAFVLGGVLDLIGYLPGAQAQTAGTLHGLLILMVLTPVCGQLLSLFSMIFYTLNKKKHQAICMKLLGDGE
ncbi:TPA: MFS transporter [Citrobacter amalonaticus]|nr:MFS transporter [Citrobacter amalonaticus]HED1791090.1 MFS transporter [Citrobacter amalonaticus]